MKLKKIIRLIDEVGVLLDVVDGAMALDPSTKEELALPRVSEDEIRAMQSAMVVISAMLKGDAHDDAMRLAIDMITTCGLSKLTDEDFDAYLKLVDTVGKGAPEDGGEQPRAQGDRAPEAVL